MTGDRDLVTEIVGGEVYDYQPLGDHVVRAPAVCAGEPTFKYTRIRIQHALDRLAGGESIEKITADYGLAEDAVREAATIGRAAQSK